MWQISRTGTEQFDTGTTLAVLEGAHRHRLRPGGQAGLRQRRRRGARLRVHRRDRTASFGTVGRRRDLLLRVGVRQRRRRGRRLRHLAPATCSSRRAVPSEVWRVSPGPNARFDGVAPTGDDVREPLRPRASTAVSTSRGSPTARSATPCSSPTARSQQVAGGLQDGSCSGRRIDVAAIKMRRPAGIALAPASDDPTRTEHVRRHSRAGTTTPGPEENDGAMLRAVGCPDLGPVTPGPQQGTSR